MAITTTPDVDRELRANCAVIGFTPSHVSVRFWCYEKRYYKHVEAPSLSEAVALFLAEPGRVKAATRPSRAEEPG
jgi:hypothetical protein